MNVLSFGIGGNKNELKDYEAITLLNLISNLVLVSQHPSILLRENFNTTKTVKNGYYIGFLRVSSTGFYLSKEIMFASNGSLKNP